MKYSLIILLVGWQSVFSQSFTTRITPKIMGRQDVLQVEYVASNVSIDQFNLPRFINWTLVSGPNLSSSKIVSGSGTQEETIYSVMLQPQITGVIVIPGATALINNKPQRSNPVTVQVKNVMHAGGQAAAPAQPTPPMFDLLPRQMPTNQALKRGENAIEKIKNNLFVRLEMSKQSCYVGEAIIATYKLCTRLKSKSKVVKQPTFSGCTVDELTNSYQDQHIEKINGQEYNVFIIRKVRLIPLEQGQLTLPPIAVENNVSFYTAGSTTDIFGNMAGPTEDHVITQENKPVTVNVKPLPSYAGNAVFSGGIGDFNLAVKSVEPVFTTNGTNHLKFIIEGVGNLQPVKMPAINWPKGIESFEATQNEETDKDNSPVISRKIFTIPFVADKMGNYVLPPLSFTYFDPNLQQYVTKSTSLFLFRVNPGNKKIVSQSPGMNDDGDFDQRLYVLLGAALLVIIIGIAWYSGTRRGKLPPEIKAETPAPIANMNTPTVYSGAEELYTIRQLEPAENTSAFYKQLNKSLADYLQKRFQIQPAEIRNYADQHLRISVPLLELSGLLDTCRLGMYTPAFNMEEAMQHRLKAIDILESLEKEA